MSETASESKIIAIHDLLSQVVEQLAAKFDGKLVDELEYEVRAEIANDSDWHRSRIGTMNYGSFYVLSVNGQRWIVAYGMKGGAYPGDNQYSCDIIAFPVTVESAKDDFSDLVEFFNESVSRSGYFASTILIGTVSGYVACTRNGRYSELLDGLFEELNGDQIYACRAEEQSDVVTLDLRTIYSKQAMYKPEAVAIFVDLVTTVLTTST